MNSSAAKIRLSGTRGFVVALRLGFALWLLARAATEARSDESDVSRISTVATPPAWAADAIWYQIFVERFRNGDPKNDPRPKDIRGAWPHLAPAGWRTTPWGQDWYHRAEWEDSTGQDFYTTVAARRYGGDLQGVLDRLDDLVDLGINAIYLNPINDSPSLHKYDCRSWRHIDRNFGPDPDGDQRVAETESPDDPTTWKWTAADRLFLALIGEAHARGIRIIMDYSFNHTGASFWAWRDVVSRQRESAYASWYAVEQFDHPDTPENEFRYRGWAGVRELPELRKIGPTAEERGEPREGDLDPAVKRHVFAVVRRWLDPNGDGDPSDGVDGFRLDVAELVPIGFWRDFRAHVKSIQPDAYLVAELWWEEWPDRLLDPSPWLRGDVFDAAMNYRWYVPVRSFVARAPPELHSRELAQQLLAVTDVGSRAFAGAMMNVAATHDTPRLATSLFNSGKYKFRVSPKTNPDYRFGRPDAKTRALQRLVLVVQFTWLGAPHIWYGDEVGMWGADDPDCRKPMVWEDLVYEDESRGPNGGTRPAESVAADRELRAHYRTLARIRRTHASLFRSGAIEIREEETRDDDVFVFHRRSTKEHAVIAINRGSSPKTVALRFERGHDYADALDPEFERRSAGPNSAVRIEPLGARILLRRPSAASIGE